MYGNESVTREQIEAGACEANCEFVWGLPDGFGTQSEENLYYRSTFYLTGVDSWETEPKWWPTPVPRDCLGAPEEACDLGA